MAEVTGIAWTATEQKDGTITPGSTWNPWWGCQRVSPGCEHCYAETFAKRTGHLVWGPSQERRMLSEKNWGLPVAWNAAAARTSTRRRVFCASMADVFEDRRDLDAPRARAFELMETTPWLDWQVLTKRPDKMLELAPERWRDGWPRNVWAGTTVEDQKRAGERIPALLKVPARVRFLSCEPLLARIDLSPWLVPPRPDFGTGPGGGSALEERAQFEWDQAWKGKPAIDWVIVGGESGPGARPFDVDWARDLVDQTGRTNTPVFVKQFGSMAMDGGARVRHEDSKGGDPAEWPAELRVREFPVAS